MSEFIHTIGIAVIAVLAGRAVDRGQYGDAVVCALLAISLMLN